MLVITFNKDDNDKNTITYSYQEPDNKKTFLFDTTAEMHLSDGNMDTVIMESAQHMDWVYFTTRKIGWKVPSSLPKGSKLEASGETTNGLIFFTIDGTTTEATFPLISNTQLGTLQLYMTKKTTGVSMTMDTQLQFVVKEKLSKDDWASIDDNLRSLVDFIESSEFYDYSYYTTQNYDLLINCEFTQGAI